jgi:hypothetical protein
VLLETAALAIGCANHAGSVRSAANEVQPLKSKTIVQSKKSHRIVIPPIATSLVQSLAQ